MINIAKIYTCSKSIIFDNGKILVLNNKIKIIMRVYLKMGYWKFQSNQYQQLQYKYKKEKQSGIEKIGGKRFFWYIQVIFVVMGKIRW